MVILMREEIKWLDNPEIFRVNQIPAHSDHTFYLDKEEWGNNNSSLMQCIDGNWDFKYSINAQERPKEFYKEEYQLEEFTHIVVPGHIELAGYDKIHYVNTMYPWDGHIYRRPLDTLDELNMGEGSFSDAAYNPVGSYRKNFDLEKGLIGKRVSICFEGVEQAMYVWINGIFLGYAEDSFTPSEFDLTPYIKEKNNILAVEVHKRSSAAFLEDQDFFRFFGIFRSVKLYAKPDIHVEDIWVQPQLYEDNVSGTLEVQIKLSEMVEKGIVHLSLLTAAGEQIIARKLEVKEKITFKSETFANIIPWSNENPYLYMLLLEIENVNGKLLEVVPCQVGFRRVEIKNNIMLLNGKRLIINGVNRHEWSAETGRCISQQEMESDIEIILKSHINAVRTSHYPNQIPWYQLCDKNGIYLMAETNMETHGSWQKMGKIEPSWNLPGNHPKWKEVVLDRARSNYEIFKNHPAILFWSLGNESYAEENIASMNRLIKEKQDGRLIHYEGVFHNRKYEDCISDIESRMYAQPKEVEEYLKKYHKKPFILCEYMHCMGNSLGGMKSYMDLLDKYDMYQGGFIWDFIDQALWVKDEVSNKRVLRYGGDFDDRPSDYEFSGNGILFADRTEKPAIQEVRYYYEKYK